MSLDDPVTTHDPTEPATEGKPVVDRVEAEVPEVVLPMPPRRPMLDLGLVLLLVAFSFVMRQWHLGLPETRYFDETYYSKSGEELLAGKPDSNTVHPPLAKLIIATVGWFYKAIGTPLQQAGWVGGVTDWTTWRAGSVLFALLMVPLTYALGMRLFRCRFTAVVATFLLSIDFLHLVQSRITMLDMYLAFFILLGGYAAWRFIEAERQLAGWAVLSVLSFAIGFACKWNSLFAGFGAFVAMLLLKRYPPSLPTALDRVLRGLGQMIVVGGAALYALVKVGADLDFAYAGWMALFALFAVALLHVLGVGRLLPPLRGPGLWFTRISFMYLFLVPLIYLAAFVPFIWQHRAHEANWSDTIDKSWADAVDHHKVMINFRYSKEFTHRYMSNFWSWPTMMRPVWYHYEEHKDPEGSLFAPRKDTFILRTVWRSQEPDTYVTGILAMGSPFVWWTYLIFMLLTVLQSLLMPMWSMSSAAWRAAMRPVPVEAPAGDLVVEDEISHTPMVSAPADTFAAFRAGLAAGHRAFDEWRFGFERPWVFLLLMYTPQVLLWSVNRGFLFYMLPCVPFMCIFIAGILREWLDLPYGHLCAAVYLVVATLFFAAYYPLLAGWSIPKPIYDLLIFTPKWI